MKIKKLVINGLEMGSIAIADRFLLRLRGMLGRDFDQFDALLIEPCSEIHPLFLAYPIDVLCIDKMRQVIMIEENVEPWIPCIGTEDSYAYSVIELPAGKAGEWEIRVGDHISIQ